MSTVSSFLFTAGVILRALCELARYAFRFGWAMVLPKARLAARLAARVLAAESQLAIELNRGGGKRQRRQFTAAFRLLWVALSKLLEGWEDLAHLMKPDTATRWHRRAFRLFWRRRSRPGRPPIPDEMQQLIRHLSRENPLWGPDRIRDTLLLLGYDAPCAETLRKHMAKPRKARSYGPSTPAVGPRSYWREVSPDKPKPRSARSYGPPTPAQITAYRLAA